MQAYVWQSITLAAIAGLVITYTVRTIMTHRHERREMDEWDRILIEQEKALEYLKDPDTDYRPYVD